MLESFFHAWERRLAAVSTDRVVRPFEWGLDWIPADRPSSASDVDALDQWISRVMADTDAFFTPPPTREYRVTEAPESTALVDLSKCVHDAARRKQHGVLPILSGAAFGLEI